MPARSPLWPLSAPPVRELGPGCPRAGRRGRARARSARPGASARARPSAAADLPGGACSHAGHPASGWWRSGTATHGPTRVPRTPRGRAKRRAASPGGDPRRPAPTRRSCRRAARAHAGTGRSAHGTRPRPRRAHERASARSRSHPRTDSSFHRHPSNDVARARNSPRSFARLGRLNWKHRGKETQMGKIVMSGPQNVSLDGVVQDPDGKEGFRLGGWFVQFGGKDLEEWNKVALDEALGAEAWLLGRRSYEFFGARWRPRSGELADRLNSIPKYVVSSTLVDPDWNNSTVLKGDVVEEASKLKQELDGEIVVPGSYQLGRTLIAHDLVDELRLVVFPVVLGAGERLFGDTSDKKPMRLADTKTIGDGLVFLTYEFVRQA